MDPEKPKEGNKSVSRVSVSPPDTRSSFCLRSHVGAAEDVARTTIMENLTKLEVSSFSSRKSSVVFTRARKFVLEGCGKATGKAINFLGPGEAKTTKGSSGNQVRSCPGRAVTQSPEFTGE